MITIIAVGKKHDANLAPAIADYEKRLRAPFDIRWALLPYSAKNGDAARDDESAAILARLSQHAFVILLDERGAQMTSSDFSQMLERSLSGVGNVVIVIGGAYGVNDELRRRANALLSLSQMVFPHQLVRLILVEQLYRAMAISQHHPYHHE